jgi:hypothetical protein
MEVEGAAGIAAGLKQEVDRSRQRIADEQAGGTAGDRQHRRFDHVLAEHAGARRPERQPQR